MGQPIAELERAQVGQRVAASEVHAVIVGEGYLKADVQNIAYARDYSQLLLFYFTETRRFRQVDDDTYERYE